MAEEQAVHILLLAAIVKVGHPTSNSLLQSPSLSTSYVLVLSKMSEAPKTFYPNSQARFHAYDLTKVCVVRELVAGHTLVMSDRREPPKWASIEKCSMLVFYLDFFRGCLPPFW
jgi:hypothetical protein